MPDVTPSRARPVSPPHRSSVSSRKGPARRRRSGTAWAAGLTAAVLTPVLAGCVAAGPKLAAAPALADAAVVRVLPAGAAAPVPASSGWTLKAASEFSTPTPKPSLWSIGEPWDAAPGFVQSEDAYCPKPQTGQVAVSGGALKLNAIVKPTAGKRMQSCFVTTRNKFSFTHGYVEARVKLPSSPGLWPAFWLLGNGTGANGWPKTGEIDMFEFANNGKDNGVPFITVHWGGNCNGGHCLYAQNNPYPAKISNYAGQWITYGMRRTASSLTFYVNGKQTVTIPRTTRNAQGQQLGAVLFDSPMHIRLDLSAGGWAQNPASATQAGTFAIDYVRVWS